MPDTIFVRSTRPVGEIALQERDNPVPGAERFIADDAIYEVVETAAVKDALSAKHLERVRRDDPELRTRLEADQRRLDLEALAAQQAQRRLASPTPVVASPSDSEASGLPQGVFEPAAAASVSPTESTDQETPRRGRRSGGGE
jgi:hypothetical protein